MNKSELEKEVAECHAYLASGGFGEVLGSVYAYAEAGHKKVQNDTALELAILELAQETLMRRTRIELYNVIPEEGWGEDEAKEGSR